MSNATWGEAAWAVGRFVLPLAVLMLLTSCGAAGDNTSAERAAPGADALEFEPIPSSNWMNQVVTRFEADERSRVARVSLAYFSGLSGQPVAIPEVSVRMLGSMSGPNTFSGTIEDVIHLPVMYSGTPPEEHVAQALLRDTVGLFTSTADCEREIRRRCLTGCGGGGAAYYDLGRFSEDYSDETVFKQKGRWDRCQVRDGVIKTGPKGRAMWCDVFEINHPHCQASAAALARAALRHPLPKCEYHHATIVVYWLSAYTCTLERHGWSCEWRHLSSDCGVSALSPGAPTAPHCPEAGAYTAGEASAVQTPTEDAIRRVVLAGMLQETFTP